MPQCQCFALRTGEQCKNNVKNGDFCHVHKQCQQRFTAILNPQTPTPPWSADFYTFRDFVDNFVDNDKTPIGDYREGTGRYQKWVKEAEKYQVAPGRGKSKTIEAALAHVPDNIVPPGATKEEKEVAYKVWEWFYLLNRFYNDGDVYGITEMSQMRYIDPPSIDRPEGPAPAVDSPEVREYLRELNRGINRVAAHVHFILEKYKNLSAT